MHTRFAAFFMLLVAALFVAREANAQCGAKRTSCSACHDGARATLPSGAAWHENHAFADVCTTCHGGRGDATDPAVAHVGLVNPLARADEQCGACHGAETTAFVARYRAASRGPSDAGAAPQASSSDSATPLPTSAPRAHGAHGDSGPNLALTGTVVAIFALGALFIARQEHARNADFQE